MRMKQLFSFLIILILSLSLFAEKGADSFRKSTLNYVPDQVVVKLKKDANSDGVNTSALNSILFSQNVEEYRQIFKPLKNKKAMRTINMENIFELKLQKGSNVLAVAEELNKLPYVEYAEPNYINPLDDFTPNDPLFASQYHLPQVSAPAAWDIQRGDTTVIIGIIDSGVDWDHEDLADAIWTNPGEIPDNGIDDDNNGYIDDVRGWDFVANVTDVAPGEDGNTPDNDPMDFDGHGTHVAGIASATTNNSLGISALAYGARIMPLRCGWQASDGNGYVSSTYAAEAYAYAADNGALVTNQSSGSSGQLIVDAAYYAFANGVLIVESAGNSNAPTASALGSQPFVMTVASVNNVNQKASYSSYGDYVDISAPGGDFSSGNRQGILSTYVYAPGETTKYVQLQGTSMASPMVASLAGLIRQAEPGLDVLDLYTRIQATADDIDGINPSYVGMLGAGVINAYNALTNPVTATPEFKILGFTIENDANSNGRLDPGETADLNVIVQNTWKDATGINVTVSPSNVWPLSFSLDNAVIDNLPGILDVDNSVDTLTFQIQCATDAYPLIDTITVSFTDGASFSQELSFSLAISSAILVVGDYDDLDVSSYYTDALLKNNLVYDYIDKRAIQPTADLLSKYPIVIWSCEWAFPSLDSLDRAALSGYLNNGGNLFISGQDIGWDMADISSAQYNEYGRSNGASLTFYQNYLKANYLADAASYSSLNGVAGDPIGDGLSFNFFQPGRSSSQQYPDVISGRDGAVPVFQYPDGQAGAIRYEAAYKLLYFSFGGYEAITDEQTRTEVMTRIISWFNGIQIQHEPLTDTENSTDPIDVSVTVSGTADYVNMYWKTASESQFRKVELADMGNGLYQGQIPAQNPDTDVEYYLLAGAPNGAYSATAVYSFHVGPDQILPVVTLVNSPYDTVTVNAFGPAPYLFHVRASDNLGINPDSVKINVVINDVKVQEVVLADSGDGNFYGTFSFGTPLEMDQIVSYYFSAVDVSANGNKGMSEMYSFRVDTAMVVDNFESGLDNWTGGTYWGLGTLKYEGTYSLDDNPAGNYENNVNDDITYVKPFNLSNYQTAYIKLWARHIINIGDTCFVEISTDQGNNWQTVHYFTDVLRRFTEIFIDLNQFAGNSDVRLRFRMQTDESDQSSGINIDAIRFFVSENLLGTGNEGRLVKEFELKPNYPNPFNPSTEFQFTLPAGSVVELTVYNIMGQKIEEVVNKFYNAGTHTIRWEAKRPSGEWLPSGLYIYQFKAGKIIKTGKMLLVK